MVYDHSDFYYSFDTELLSAETEEGPLPEIAIFGVDRERRLYVLGPPRISPSIKATQRRSSDISVVVSTEKHILL